MPRPAAGPASRPVAGTLCRAARIARCVARTARRVACTTATALTAAASVATPATAATVPATPAPATPTQVAPQSDSAGIPVRDQGVIDACQRCHAVDDAGRMSRVSFMRKTPEGWQQSIRRMATLNDMELDPEDARRIVRYLSDHHGLAPEELEPGRFEVERRLIEWSYEADKDVAYTCSRCHSMGRVVTQRRTKEEWELLMAMHRGYYPLSDTQGFRRIGPPPPDATDTRHPMDKAVAHFAKAFPLDTPEWTAWSATMRPPGLEGTWALRGHDPGRGPIYGTVSISAGDDASSFATQSSYVNARTGAESSRTGRAVVYTGYQWRGRSFAGRTQGAGIADTALREVMTVDRSRAEINGRWFRGAYDEFGPDVTLVRADGPVLLGLYPVSARTGASDVAVRIYGANLAGTGASAMGAPDMIAPDMDPSAVDMGPGVDVLAVEAGEGDFVLATVAVDEDAAPGARDVYVNGRAVPGAFTVYRQVDRIAVEPRVGMARLGGGTHFPKGYAQFQATAFANGPDSKPETADDLDLGQADVTWLLEEYAAVFDDDDLEYVGTLDQNGLFEPALDGPNPRRSGQRNNVGDVWVVATYQGPGDNEVRGRAHLVVTVPLYMRWEPWRVQEVLPPPPRSTGR